MALAKIADLYPDYKKDIFNGEDIKGYSVYDNSNDKIGSVHDIIVDETGRFRYLVIDTGFWVFGKKVLLPVGRASVDYSQHRIYAQGLTKEQAESLPKYDEGMTIDYDY
ncbi:MAG: PRC-barrel domain-containing protein, partial [Waterburya sp.]